MPFFNCKSLAIFESIFFIHLFIVVQITRNVLKWFSPVAIILIFRVAVPDKTVKTKTRPSSWFQLLTWAYLSTTPSPRFKCVPAVQLLPNCCCDSTIRNNLFTMSLSRAPATDSLDGTWTFGRRFLALRDRPCRMPTPEHCVVTHNNSRPAAQRTVAVAADITRLPIAVRDWNNDDGDAQTIGLRTSFTVSPRM